MANPVAVLTGYLIVDTRTDIENDTNPASQSSAFCHLEATGAQSGDFVFRLPTSVAALLVNGPVTVTLTQ